MKTRSMTVVDDAHTAAAKTLQDMCSLLNDGIDAYIKVLNQVTTEAAKEGNTTQRYQEYADLITSLKGQLARVGNLLNATATDYVSKIDTADSYLY